jgi:hypothetical protein
VYLQDKLVEKRMSGALHYAEWVRPWYY